MSQTETKFLDRVEWEGIVAKAKARAEGTDWGRLATKCIVSLIFLAGWLLGYIARQALMGGYVLAEAAEQGYKAAGGPKLKRKRVSGG